MTAYKIDPRIVRLGIVIDGNINWYEGLSIEIKGIKVSESIMGQCEISILNLRRDVREYILQETNPFLNRGKQISVIAEVGRVSYGTTTLYQGDVFRSDPTPRPDMGVRLICIQGFFNKAKIVSLGAKEISKLSTIASWVAESNGYSLAFEIPDKNIGRYSFTGSSQAAILQLEALCGSGVNVYVDNSTLHVKNTGTPSKGYPVRILDKYSGLLKAGGTEFGCKIEMLFDNVTRVGGRIDLTSELNPSLNGSYVVRRLGFHITSRDVPFYYTAECDRRS